MTAVNYSNPKISFTYIVITAVAVFASWELHELAHYLTGTYLGYRMGMSLNTGFPIQGHYNSDIDYQIISAAGPIFTLAEAMIVFSMMYRKNLPSLYPFLYTCFYMRLLAAVLSFIHPNDEARISRSIGLGLFTLPVISVAIFFFLLYKIAKQYGFTTKFNLITMVLIIAFSTAIIFSDQFFHIRFL